MTLQRQDRHLHLIHLRNSMIKAEDTSCRAPGLANVQISGQTVRRRLRDSELGVRLWGQSLNNAIGLRN